MVRRKAGERQSGYWTDDASAVTSLDDLINEKIRGWRSWVMSRGGLQSFALRETWALVSGTASYVCDGTAATAGTDNALDRILELHVLWSDQHHERIEPIDEVVFERYSAIDWAEYGRKGYLFRAATLYFSPTPNVAKNVGIVYIPRFTVLSATTNTLVAPEGMAECVALEAACEIRGERDLSTAYVEKALARAEDHLREAVNRLHAHDLPKMRDVNPEGLGLGLYTDDYVERLPPP